MKAKRKRHNRFVAPTAPDGERQKPDILERLRATYGDFVLPEEEAIAILDENKGNW